MTMTILGKKTSALSADSKKRLPFQFAIVEAGEIVASHNPDTFTVNANYPDELQPRLRGRTANRVQVEKMARDLNPDPLITDLHSIDRGAPIVGPDNVVESGNGRVMAILRATTLHPQVFNEYKNALKVRAEEVGLSSAQVDGFTAPVLVRVRQFEAKGKARAAFAEAANQAAILTTSATEKARGDAKNISTPMLNSLVVGEDQGIDEALRARKNLPFVTAYLRTLPETEQAALIDAGGVVNQEGIRRMGTAVFARAYPGDVGLRLASKFFESTDPAIRNVFKGLTASLPRTARAEALAQAGERDKELSIAEDVAKTVETYAAIKAAGRTVDDHLAQQAMFERELDPFQERLLREIDSRRRSSKRIGELLGSYADVVIAQPPPAQASMLAGPRITKEQVLDTTLRQEGSAETTQATQASMLEGKGYQGPAFGSAPAAPVVTFGAGTAQGVVETQLEAEREQLATQTPAEAKEAFDRVQERQARSAPEPVKPGVSPTPSVAKAPSTTNDRQERAKRLAATNLSRLESAAPRGLEAFHEQVNRARRVTETAFNMPADAEYRRQVLGDLQKETDRIQAAIAAGEYAGAPRKLTDEDRARRITEPWTATARQYQAMKGVHEPWIAEISPMQYARLSKRGKAEYDRKRAGEWHASGEVKAEWSRAVLAAHKAGKFKPIDRGVTPDARSVVYAQERRQKERRAKQRTDTAHAQNQIMSTAGLKVGDRVVDTISRQSGQIVKVNQKSVRIRYDKPMAGRDEALLRVSSKTAMLTWVSHDEAVRRAETGQTIGPSSDAPPPASTAETVARAKGPASTGAEMDAAIAERGTRAVAEAQAAADDRDRTIDTLRGKLLADLEDAATRGPAPLRSTLETAKVAIRGAYPGTDRGARATRKALRETVDAKADSLAYAATTAAQTAERRAAAPAEPRRADEVPPAIRQALALSDGTIANLIGAKESTPNQGRRISHAQSDFVLWLEDYRKLGKLRFATWSEAWREYMGTPRGAAHLVEKPTDPAEVRRWETVEAKAARERVSQAVQARRPLPPEHVEAGQRADREASEAVWAGSRVIKAAGKTRMLAGMVEQLREGATAGVPGLDAATERVHKRLEREVPDVREAARAILSTHTRDLEQTAARAHTGERVSEADGPPTAIPMERVPGTLVPTYVPKPVEAPAAAATEPRHDRAAETKGKRRERPAAKRSTARKKTPKPADDKPGVGLNRARGAFMRRPLRGRLVDAGINAENVAPKDAKTPADRRMQRRYARNPNRLDYEGVDTQTGPRRSGPGRSKGGKRTHYTGNPKDPRPKRRRTRSKSKGRRS